MVLESPEIFTNETMQKQVRENKQKGQLVEKLSVVYEIRKRLQNVTPVIGLMAFEINSKDLLAKPKRNMSFSLLFGT